MIKFFSFSAPIPIFHKNKFPDPITDQILTKIPIKLRSSIPPKSTPSTPKKTTFFENDSFYSMIIFIPFCENEQRIIGLKIFTYSNRMTDRFFEIQNFMNFLRNRWRKLIGNLIANWNVSIRSTIKSKRLFWSNHRSLVVDRSGDRIEKWARSVQPWSIEIIFHYLFHFNLSISEFLPGYYRKITVFHISP
jgi:hypothetical protein